MITVRTRNAKEELSLKEQERGSDFSHNDIFLDGRKIGTISFSFYTDNYGSNALGIGNFMIIERGKGYGTQVIKDIVSKYKSKYDLIYCFVDSDNKGAISLYKKLGKVYDEDPSDSYYVTFYDNGKYKPEKSSTEDLNSMLPHYQNLQNEDRDYVLSFLSKDPTWNEKKESGQYSKWILDKLNRKIIDNNILGHLGDLLARFEKNKKQLKDKDIMKFKSIDDLENYLNDENNYTDLSHRQEVRQRQKDRHNVNLVKDADLVYEDSDWEVWIPKTYAASCKLGQGTKWCTASTETPDYFDNYNEDGNLYININKHDKNEKYQFHFETEQFMDKDDEEINLESFFLKNQNLYRNFYSKYYNFDIDAAQKPLDELKKNNYTYYWSGENVPESFRGLIKKLVISDSVTSIGDYAFSDCSSLTSITIPNSITSIGHSAFACCDSLTTVTIGNRITIIEDFAFFKCKSLTSIEIPNSVTNIGSSAFSGCTQLTNIFIPDSIKSIGYRAFYYCPSLKSIVIPDSVTIIGFAAFASCPALTIYCEATSKPNDWTNGWNPQNRPVVWGYKGKTVKESFANNYKEHSDKLSDLLDNIETPEELMSWMEQNISYELANDEYGAEDDPPTKTAEEVIETGTGHCAEQSYLEKAALDALGYETQLVFVKENSSQQGYGPEGSAHVFLIYKDEKDDFCWFEHSMEHARGIHKYQNLADLLQDVANKWWRYDENSDILEVRFLDNPITGINNWQLAQACYDYPVGYIFNISNNKMEKII